MPSETEQEILHLRGTALNNSLGALMRIKAANELLVRFGATDNIAVLMQIIKVFEAATDADISNRAQKLRAKLMKRLEKTGADENAIQIPDAFDAEDIAGTESPNLDEWDREVLNREEQFRLVEIQRPYTVFVRGNSVLRPGAVARELVEVALDGRPFNVHVLRKLHSHMQNCFSRGGIALGSGPLFSELTRTLKAKGALHMDPNGKSYGDKLMEELNLRS